MASFKQLPSGNWRVQVRRKGTYASQTLRRHKDATEMSPEERPTFLNIGKAIKSAGKLCELGERLTEAHSTELDSLMDEMVRGRDYVSNLLHSCLFEA